MNINPSANASNGSPPVDRAVNNSQNQDAMNIIHVSHSSATAETLFPIPVNAQRAAPLNLTNPQNIPRPINVPIIQYLSRHRTQPVDAIPTPRTTSSSRFLSPTSASPNIVPQALPFQQPAAMAPSLNPSTEDEGATAALMQLSSLDDLKQKLNQHNADFLANIDGYLQQGITDEMANYIYNVYINMFRNPAEYSLQSINLCHQTLTTFYDYCVENEMLNDGQILALTLRIYEIHDRPVPDKDYQDESPKLPVVSYLKSLSELENYPFVKKETDGKFIYINTMTNMGYKVAKCSDSEDPAHADIDRELRLNSIYKDPDFYNGLYADYASFSIMQLRNANNQRVDVCVFKIIPGSTFLEPNEKIPFSAIRHLESIGYRPYDVDTTTFIKILESSTGQMHYLPIDGTFISRAGSSSPRTVDAAVHTRYLSNADIKFSK